MLLSLLSLSVGFPIYLPNSVESTGSTGSVSQILYISPKFRRNYWQYWQQEVLCNIFELCMLLSLLSLSVRFSISLPISVESTVSTGSVSQILYISPKFRRNYWQYWQCQYKVLCNISEQCTLLSLLSLSVRFSISLPNSVASTGSTGSVSRKCYVIFLNSVCG